jgi:signal transduction histidine kinase
MEIDEFKILVVDDNPKNVELLANLLYEKGYDVEYALTGPNALTLVASEDFDLILLDIMMPGMDGFEVCKRIKKDTNNSEIPIIFLTAKTDIESIEKAFKYGGLDYVNKPFNSNELLARVKTHVELKVSKDKLKKVNDWLEERVFERTAELEKSMAILENKNYELEQFAYIASHDLQEPLRTVSSFVDLLEQEHGGKLKGNASKYLYFILESTERMRNLISGLLEYSRIGREKIVEQVDCNEILTLVLDDLQTIIIEKKAIIESEKLPVLNAHPSELKQLFQNLISNALKFSREDTPPVINIFALKQENGWEFKIKDNGIGIEEKFFEKIFIIFQRLHNVHEYEGTGIGLAHCRKIVEMHDGKIWVESESNEGSTFYFTINMQ